MTSPRDKTKRVKVRNVEIGGGAPIVVQSMTTTRPSDVDATVAQIRSLEAAGCEIVRVAVPDDESAQAIPQIIERIGIPLVADIHFRADLAIRAIDAGVHKMRFNPGNIESREDLKTIVQRAAERDIPIRVGVNSGSIDRRKYGRPSAESLCQCALDYTKMVEDLGQTQIVVSAKAFDVPMTIRTYRLLAEKTRYPLHLGVTEAGLPWSGTIRSAVGIGALLSDGTGDTIRVSLTGDPVEEVRVGWEILSALDLRRRGVTLISCPSCGRAEVDIVAVAEDVERRMRELRLTKPMTVAVMGCVVNGPGEARDADIGVACGKGSGVIFRAGETLKTVGEAEIAEALVELARDLAE
jgi:(E)-4-hydroxy-3-methylbut-2-enyl-diphosphate synthase